MTVEHKDLIDPTKIHPTKTLTDAGPNMILGTDNDGNEVAVAKGDVGGSQGDPGDKGDSVDIDNIVIVQKVPQAGQFSSIKAAVDSITDASPTNPYIIDIGPQVYTENSIIMKSDVHLRGAGPDRTIINPVDINNDIIKAASHTSITGLSITGATNANGINCELASGSFHIEDCHIKNNKIHVNVIGSTGTGQTIYVWKSVLEGTHDSAICIDSSAAIPAKVFVNECFFEAGSAIHCLFLTGDGSRLFINGCSMDGEGGSAHAVHMEDGSYLGSYGFEMEGFDEAIRVDNVGAAPTIIAAGVQFRDNINFDINITHPGTKGIIAGSGNLTKAFVDPSAPLAVAGTTFDDVTDTAGSVNIGDFFLGRDLETLLNLTFLTEKSVPLGLYTSHDVLTKGAGTVVNIETGRTGYMEVPGSPDKYYEVKVNPGAAPYDPGPNKDVYLITNKDGVVSETASLANTRYQVALGRVITDATSIIYIENAPPRGYHLPNQLMEFVRDVFGSIFVSGSTLSENAGAPFNLDAGSGVYYFGENKKTPVGGSQIPFIQHHRNTPSGWITSLTQTLNNAQYDNGSGTLQPLTTSYYKKDWIFLSGDSSDETYFSVISQDEYATSQAARDAAAPIIPSYFRDATVVIASVIIKQGDLNIVEINSERPLPSFQAAAGTGATSHGDLTDLLLDHHTQYLLVSGARAMSGNFDMGTNNITNVGLVDGVDVSAHASRHLPNGSDPIATASAGTLDANGANAEGTANSLARSDHNHKIRLKHLGSTEMTLQQMQDQNHSTGTLGGFALAPNGSTPQNLDIGAGTCLIRETDSDIGVLDYYTYPGSTDNVIADLTRSFIYIDYNAGSPALEILTTRSTNYHQKVFLGSVYRDGTDLHISLNSQIKVSDHAAAMALRLNTVNGYSREMSGGANTTEVGTRNLAISLGNFWCNLNQFTTPAKNTQTTDDFDYFYNRAAYTKQAIQTQISNTQYDNAGTLSAMTTNYFRADYVYMEEDGHLEVIYGDAEYATLSEAKADPLPTVFPAQLEDHSILLAKIIIQEGAAVFSLLLNAFDDVLVTALSDVDLNTNKATATLDDTVTSLTPVVVDSMTLTPPAGNYLVSFSSSGNVSATAADGVYALFKAGTIIQHTERNMNFGGGAATGDQDTGMHTQDIISVNGAEAIDVRAQVNTGNFVIHERSLVLVKVGS